MATKTNGRGVQWLVIGCLVGALGVGGLAMAGFFEEKPGVQVDRGGVEINLPDKIEIGKKK